MLSRTESIVNSSSRWNVRPMPWRARFVGLEPGDVAVVEADPTRT